MTRAPKAKKPPQPSIHAVATVLAVLLSVNQAGLFFGQSGRWVRKRIDRRLLPHRRVGGRIFMIRSELEEFIQQCPGTTVREAQANLAMRSGGVRQ